jgi:TolB-like protein/Tfp pilus assembly protein PilF
MNFLAELRRRNVIRMAGLYLVGAWLATQVAATLLPVFEAPAWATKAVVGLLAAGFIPALVIAWVFELTPDGLKRDTDVPEAQSIAPQTARKMERMFLVLLALALGLFAFDRFVLAPRRDAALVAATAKTIKAETAATRLAAVSEKSIAVLPFVNMSADKDNEYFSDGIAEEILNALAHVDGLKVAGRTSSFHFKGRNESLTSIGQTLGVAHVLEGSVRKQGGKVRITAQLIRVQDGYHQWSETYDGDLQDVFALQERIARAITEKLRVTLSGKQARQLVDTGTRNTEAYALYLQASAIFDRRDGEHMPEAVKKLEQAIALDPTYARAYSRLAAVHAILPTYTGGNVAKSREQVRTNARRAIELEPGLAEPWAAMGMASPLGGSGLIQSRQCFEKALQLDPDDITTNFWFGLTLVRSGYNRAGLERIEHALAVDPMVPNVMRWRGVLYLRDGNIDGAEQFLKRAQAAGLRLAGRELGEIAFRRGDVALARRSWQAGSRAILDELPAGSNEVMARALFGGNASDRERGVAIVDAHLASHPTVVPGMLPFWLAQLGHGADAMELERTRVNNDNSDFLALLFSPAGKPLRELPEFPAYLSAKGFPALWDKYGAPDMCRKLADGSYACQ